MCPLMKRPLSVRKGVVGHSAGSCHVGWKGEKAADAVVGGIRLPQTSGGKYLCRSNLMHTLLRQLIEADRLSYLLVFLFGQSCSFELL